MKTLKILSSIIVSLALTSAYAEEEYLQFLTVSEGISSPSTTTTLMGQNPAGLIYTQDMQAHFFLGQDNVEAIPEDYSTNIVGGFFNFGNGKIAGSAGLRNLQYSEEADTENPPSDIYVGLSFNAEALNTAFGFSGNILQDNSSGEWESTNDLDIGVLFGVEGPVKVGFTAFNVLNNRYNDDDITFRHYGVGLAYHPTEEAVVSLDAVYYSYQYEPTDTKFSLTYITPGVKIAMDVVQLSLSYRLFQGEEDDAEILGFASDAELLAGVGVAITGNLLAQLQTNRIGDYDLGVTYRF